MAKDSSQRIIRRRALRVVQDPKRPVLLFALTTDELLEVASISRVGRDHEDDLIDRHPLVLCVEIDQHPAKIGAGNIFE